VLQPDGVINIDAKGTSALNWAALAGDLAIERVHASNHAPVEVRVTNARDSRIVRALVQRLESRGVEAKWILQGDGFALLCSRARRRVDGVAALPFRWHREGVVVPRREFDALQAACASTFVPQAQEHLILDEGADPLKTF
jgi:hypothetical protein